MENQDKTTKKMRGIKLLIKGVIIVVVLVMLIPVTFILWPLTGGVIQNNIRASSYMREWRQMMLPPEIEVIEISYFVGNTAGTGNSVEIWAGMLIRSELSMEEMITHFSGYGIVDTLPNNGRLTTRQIYIYHSAFSYLRRNDEWRNLYAVGNFHAATTQFDIRGH